MATNIGNTIAALPWVAPMPIGTMTASVAIVEDSMFDVACRSRVVLRPMDASHSWCEPILRAPFGTLFGIPKGIPIGVGAQPSCPIRSHSTGGAPGYAASTPIHPPAPTCHRRATHQPHLG